MNFISIFSTILPVWAAILLGFLGRRFHFLNDSAISSIKFIVIKIVLPVAIFNALGSANYQGNCWAIIGLFLAAVVLSFLLGYLLKGLIEKKFQKYLPFMISVYEGGLVGYPLYVSLFGNENLYHMALLDIACLLFGFGIYMGLLEQAESGEKFSTKKMAISAIKNPTFIATILGLIFGITGWLNQITSSLVGPIYNSVESMLTSALSFLVLLCVGYAFSIDKECLKPTLKTIAIRFTVQVVLCAGLSCLLYFVLKVDMYYLYAVILFMACPGSFSTQSFSKSEEGSNYISTVTSLYCFITLIAYTVLAIIA